MRLPKPSYRRVQDRVDEDIDRPQMPPDDRADLRREPPLVPPFRVDAELEVRAVDELSCIRVGDGKQCSQLEAVEAPAAVVVVAVERQVKTGLEPVRHAQRPFRDAVQRVVGDDRSRERRDLDPGGRVVVVPGQIEGPDRREPAIVDLDLVCLRERVTRDGQPCDRHCHRDPHEAFERGAQ